MFRIAYLFQMNQIESVFGHVISMALSSYIIIIIYYNGIYQMYNTQYTRLLFMVNKGDFVRIQIATVSESF